MPEWKPKQKTCTMLKVYQKGPKLPSDAVFVKAESKKLFLMVIFRYARGSSAARVGSIFKKYTKKCRSLAKKCFVDKQDSVLFFSHFQPLTPKFLIL